MAGLSRTRCCFSTIRMGLINGADAIEAPVAAIIPTSPSSATKYEMPSRNPNFGIRLKPTPMSRGIRPESEAPTGLRLNDAFASAEAILGSTISPLRFLAYCWTSWR